MNHSRLEGRKRQRDGQDIPVPTDGDIPALQTAFPVAVPVTVAVVGVIVHIIVGQGVQGREHVCQGADADEPEDDAEDVDCEEDEDVEERSLRCLRDEDVDAEGNDDGCLGRGLGGFVKGGAGARSVRWLGQCSWRSR